MAEMSRNGDEFVDGLLAGDLFSQTGYELARLTEKRIRLVVFKNAIIR